VNINGDINLSHNNNYINGLQNTSDNNSYSARFSLNKDWTKKDKTVASLSLEPGITYNDNKSTISTYTTSYWSSEIRASGFVELPWKLRLNTSVEVDIRERTAVFDRNNNVVRWDAYMARKFGKKNKSEVRLSVFDILNQEKGYSRTANDNYLVENSYNTIRRYGLLSFVWNFSKLPAGTPAEKEE